MIAATYCITRWRKTKTGEEWYPVKTGLTKERAEQLVEMAKDDPRTMLCLLRVEEETEEREAEAFGATGGRSVQRQVFGRRAR